jgi:phenylpropionate dioxygenase-like ring-hydroxylating dioxygenase large terminal subunit
MISAHDPVRERVAEAMDLERGLIGRRIFVDPEIYKLELENVFRRSWLFLAHDSQIPEPGDYITTRMAETPVIVVRDNSSAVRAFINTCRHRGNPVTRNDAGCAAAFTCPYHGWTYDLQGKRVEPGSLVGLPGLKAFYDDKIDLGAWGLLPVAQIGAYRGLIFGTFDSEAPPLTEFLGDFRWFLDLILDRGDLAAAPGVVRWRMNCNWKFAADNAAGDNAHAMVAHRSAFVAMEQVLGTPHRPPGQQLPGFTLVTEYGHSANCATVNELPPPGAGPFVGDPVYENWRTRPELVAKQGSFREKIWRYNGNLFPNLFIIDNLLMLRNPIGPNETEVRAIGLFDRSASPEVQDLQRRRSFQKFGPSGLLEQEDGENWDQSTAGARIREAVDADLNYEMGIGTGRFVSDGNSPPRIESMINEHGQIWFYRFWADAMAASDWKELKANHSRPGGTM